MKPTFLGHEKPLLTVMIITETAESAIGTIRKAIPEGADAFGIQTCRLRKEYRNEEAMRRIFDEMEGRPSYLTNYRHGVFEGAPDEDVAEGMMLMARAGGTLIDVISRLIICVGERIKSLIGNTGEIIDRVKEPFTQLKR